MQIIKLNATDSTNSFLKQRILEKNIKDNTVVTAKYQTKGRGQLGETWSSEPGKNLIFSIFKIMSLNTDKQFYISIAIALAIYNALKNIQIPELAIKWPNDILSAGKKICGILIENSIKSRNIHTSIIGVGLNLNQQEFPNMPQASSLKNITGLSYHPDEILMLILKEFKTTVKLLEQQQFTALKEQYEACLFRIHKPSTFKDNNNSFFTGYIKGISDEGKLKVLTAGHIVRTFELKEVKLFY